MYEYMYSVHCFYSVLFYLNKLVNGTEVPESNRHKHDQTEKNERCLLQEKKLRAAFDATKDYY